MTNPEPKTSPLTFWIIVVVLLGGFSIYVAHRYSSPATGHQPASDQTTAAGADSVSYGLIGTVGSATLTVITPTGTQTIDSPAGGVYQYTFGSGQDVKVAAQNGSETGTVGCTISVNGTQIATDTESGAYAIAECDGTTP